MYTMCKSILHIFVLKPWNYVRNLNKLPEPRPNLNSSLTAFLVAGGTVVIYNTYRCLKNQSVVAHQVKSLDGSGGASKLAAQVKLAKLTLRERCFIKFASVQYNGQLYMTPQDFLESVVEDGPRPRLKRRTLSKSDVDYMKESTPPLNRGSPRLFRNLGDKGIISYNEYLFLLSVLIKPQSGFNIAFNMFDTDGNQRVDKNEFLVVRRSLIRKPTEVPKTMEKVFFIHVRKVQRELPKTEDSSNFKIPTEEYVNDEQGLQKSHVIDTTLLIHLFGPEGTDELRFEEFKRFMLDLQTEVLELEFNEFSKGFPTISEVDFAKMLLRYTHLDNDESNTRLDGLLYKIKETKGITFDEFYTFCQFLNNLDDFSIAVRMYTLANHPISKDEFQRAVKICTGNSLSHHIMHTVFAIFDDDGDGLLSYREFIAIMKNRLHRGSKSYVKNKGWGGFKNCMKQEMKTSI